MMEFNSFKLDITDHIAHVSFNRPEKRNSLNAPAWDEMRAIFKHCSIDPEVRVVVLSGEGKMFCAGIDVSMLMQMNGYKSNCEARKREEFRVNLLKLQEDVSSLEQCQKPVIAAIHNACIGGGVDIISSADMRFCTEDAYFVIKEVDMGLVADIGTLQRLPKLISQGLVSELAYTGRKMFAEEAKSSGLVNRVFETKEIMMESVLEMARTIAAKSPVVIRGTKEMIKYTRDHSVEESLHMMSVWNAAYIMSDDIKEAMGAFMEKRQPNYNN